MRLHKLRKAALLSVLFLGLGQVACEKFPDETIGSEIQPDGDKLGLALVDSFYIKTKSTLTDSIQSDEVNNNLVGLIYDPYFGKLSCASYLQIRLATENNSFDENKLVIDSVVLSLPYDNKFYGDTTTSLKFIVEEISDAFSFDSTYHTNRSLQTKGNNLLQDPNQSFNIRPYSSVVVGTDTVNPSLRLALTQDFGKHILFAPASNLANNTNFTAFLPGLKISVDTNNSPQPGVMAYFNTLSSLARLYIYYRDTTNQTAQSFSLPINSSSARYTEYRANYSGSAAELQLNGVVNGLDEYYVQSGGTLRAELDFPSILALKDSANLIINKAELILPIVPNSNTPLAPHDRLFLGTLNAEGKREVLPDQLEGDSHFGGFYNSSDQSYHFVITRYVQALLSGGKTYYGLQVLAGNSVVSANRTRLSGPANPLKKPKLIVTYSRP